MSSMIEADSSIVLPLDSGPKARTSTIIDEYGRTVKEL